MKPAHRVLPGQHLLPRSDPPRVIDTQPRSIPMNMHPAHASFVAGDLNRHRFLRHAPAASVAAVLHRGSRHCAGAFRVLAVLALFALTSCAHLQRTGTEPRRIVGIFGGMGPEATGNFYAEIVRLTPAKKDQDHLPVLIYSFPQVPDRSTCIASGSREIVPYLTQAVRKLERGGASFIAIPCNTVHYYHADMQRAVRIPVLNMITETADAVAREHPRARTVGLLATSATVRSKLYESEFKKRGLRVLLPGETMQQCCVMDAVYSIKSGGSKQKQADLLARAGDDLIRRGADVLVLGCTEIPLAFDVKRSRVPVVNAAQVLAHAAIREYQKGSPKP